MYIIYFLIAFISTTIGNVVGIGGALIIKPVLDMLGHYDITTIGILSSFAVASMTSVSVFKNKKAGKKIDFFIVIISIGSIIGGIIGKELFYLFLKAIGNNEIAKGIQSIILIILIGFVFIVVNYKNVFPRYHVKSRTVTLIMGIILGTIASFLSIGGGPINVAILTMMYSMNPKAAAYNSIFIKLFSQISKLGTIFVTTGFGLYDLSMLPFLIIGGICGGILGVNISKKITDDHVIFLFNVVIVFVFLINLYNAVVFFS